jgi:hypothetical protein
VRRLSPLFALFALAVGLFAGACGETIRPPAAKVNGTAIEQTALDDELEAIGSNAEYLTSIEQGGTSVRGTGAGTFDSQFVGRVLTRQIYLLLVHEEVVRRKLTVNRGEMEAGRASVEQSVGGKKVFGAFPKAYQTTLLRRTAEVVKLQGLLSGVAIDDAAIKKFYDENTELFSQTCVSHILFAVAGADGQIDQAATAAQSAALKAEADGVRAQIAGGADFAAMAAQHSKDASNKDSGGNLECGPAGRFVPEFETAMDALGNNEVSQPVQTQFGWHLIKVTGRDPQSLEEAEPTIRQRLQSDQQEGFGDFLQEALGGAKISINPRYGTFEKEGQSPGVVPPNSPTTTEPGDQPPTNPVTPSLTP